MTVQFDGNNGEVGVQAEWTMYMIFPGMMCSGIFLWLFFPFIKKKKFSFDKSGMCFSQSTKKIKGESKSLLTLPVVAEIKYG